MTVWTLDMHKSSESWRWSCALYIALICKNWKSDWKKLNNLENPAPYLQSEYTFFAWSVHMSISSCTEFIYVCASYSSWKPLTLQITLPSLLFVDLNMQPITFSKGLFLVSFKCRFSLYIFVGMISKKGRCNLLRRTCILLL